MEKESECRDEVFLIALLDFSDYQDADARTKINDFLNGLTPLV